MENSRVVQLLVLDISCGDGNLDRSKIPSQDYCSPELARALSEEGVVSDFHSSKAHDLFAFGLIFYEVVKGETLRRKDPNGYVGKGDIEDMLDWDIFSVRKKFQNMKEKCVKYLLENC